jgi:hypothetical protein
MAKKNQLVEAEQAPEVPAAKEPGKAPGKKKVEKPVQKKMAGKQSKRTIKPVAEKAAVRKPGSKKKAAGKPGKKIVAPGRKAAAKFPVAAGKKPGPKETGLVGRKADLIKMGQGAFFYSLEQQRRIEEMEQVIANYERLFEAVRGLFSREMEEIEELVAGLLE